MTGRITFTIVKPEAVAKEYTGHIFSMISSAGFHIAAVKMIRMTKEMAEKFYLVHKERPFYKDLVEFMSSGPVVVAVLEKVNAVSDYRTLIGATDPSKAAEGTIRKKYAESVQNNAVHGSDSDENAKIECDFFFSKSERYYLEGE
jgi:nucleoside-diphosphate kinase